MILFSILLFIIDIFYLVGYIFCWVDDGFDGLDTLIILGLPQLLNLIFIVSVWSGQ